LCAGRYRRYPLNCRDLEEMMRERGLAVDHVTVFRWRVKCLNNAIEQGHGLIMRRWRATQCFRTFQTAGRTWERIGSMRLMRKGQVKRLDGRDTIGQAKFVEGLFGAAA